MYYEAGFAHGLGLPVTFACREDHFNEIHFDVDHYNFIKWKDGEELGRKLTDRIRSTMPAVPAVPLPTHRRRVTSGGV